MFALALVFYAAFLWGARRLTFKRIGAGDAQGQLALVARRVAVGFDGVSTGTFPRLALSLKGAWGFHWTRSASVRYGGIWRGSLAGL